MRWADALIADAPGIARYYADGVRRVHRAPHLRRAHPRRPAVTTGRRALVSSPGGYHLVVARFEPENHVDLIVARLPGQPAELPPGGRRRRAVQRRLQRASVRAAAGDPRIRLVGAVWDQEQLDQLYAHALLYLHGHSVGGTNPSLLRAMGAGTAVAAYDVEFNRGVLGEPGRYFADETGVAALVEMAEADPRTGADAGLALRARAATEFRWDDVADGVRGPGRAPRGGYSRRGEVSGRRRASILAR